MTYDQIHTQFFPLLSGEATLTISVADAIDMIRRGIELNATHVDSDNFLDAQIENYYYISVRAKNVLLVNNYTTFREVKDAGKIKLLQCRNLNTKCITELQQLFTYHGLTLE